ncbi:IGF-like family receptor 1 [Plectropomus leopardus]|uniref:IGF-like family receptor 1 n=1 Tax=Plectropomus leopardus TaxID=160734 RepID=UPI001C4C2902|nr:IGF-like family receptor 1 [Plectropomus leopardus]
MGYSENCHDLKTYWDREKSKCVLCPVQPGYEITPNCGRDDDGGLHDLPHTECIANVTFNDGSSAFCQTCSSCSPGYIITHTCNVTTDTRCQEPRSGTSGAFTTEPTSQHVSTFSSPIAKTVPVSGPSATFVTGVVPLVILISVILIVMFACVIYMKRKRVFNRGQHTVLSYCRRASYISAGFSSLPAPSANNELVEILSPNILSSPLQSVLDNLDVLEELVILLDPEIHGVKNTKHLASLCSFPATWITYAYSMKDSKSPLKAVLEGVTSRQPDWTVGHLVKLLRHMERNDAIAALAKLEVNVMLQV